MGQVMYRAALFSVIILCGLLLWLRFVEPELVGASTDVKIPDYLVQTQSRHYAYYVFNNTKTASQKSSARSDKMIVVGKLSTEDTEWVKLLPDWNHAVYVVDDTSAPLHTKQNKGREANAYLTYIIDNYPDLPETMAFVHSHRNGNPAAWHTEAKDNDIVNGLNILNLTTVHNDGYVNLRCNPVPGCDGEMIQPWRFVNDQRPLILEHATSEAFMEAWPELFQASESDVPEQIGAPCCAQFAVSRKQVLMRPLHDYIWYHQWIMETPLSDAISGRIMEYSWHVIFGKDSVHCPDMLKCLRGLYQKGLTEKGLLWIE